MAFSAPERCGQGPYEIALHAQGHRWGEGVAFEVFSPHPLELRYELLVDDTTVREGELPPIMVYRNRTDSNGDTNLQRVVDETPFDNSGCLSTSAPGSAAVRIAAPPIGSGTSSAPPTGETPAGEPSGAVFTIAPPASGDAGATPSLELIPVSWDLPDRGFGESLYARGLGDASIQFSWDHNRQSDGPPPLPQGTIRVRFWSVAPNPLEGVVFRVRQWVVEPSVSDAEYIAYLDERAREAEADRAAADAAPPRRVRRGQRRRSERRARRSEARYAEVRERRAFCDANRESEDCWGPGGYEGLQERRRAEQAEADARRYAEADSPPPPPQPDPQSPKPSQNASWTPGYWHWVPRQWVWIGGHWDVPESDLASATIEAPSVPPPPQAEAIPPAPGPGLLWVGGFWQWDGARFVWVAGKWEPARSDATWRAPSWRIQGAGAVFVPGGWELQLTR